MEKIIKFIKNNWAAIFLTIIILAAIFVRTYKFEDWLYFKMDQSRDALLIANAVEKGPGYLPLLGPRVGAVKLEHGMLRVGPIFYYFQYLAGKIFHSTQPFVFAYPDLFFSLLAIPLVYLFVRIYFKKSTSLLITLMYASSFLIIQYSRFAWNPNSLQFFLLLAFYGLLKFLNEASEKKKRLWLATWALGLTIGSQLHFFGFFSLLGISGLMFVYHYKLWDRNVIIKSFNKSILKTIASYAVVVLAVFLIFYTPEIISDIYKKGQNTHNFFEALTAKPEQKPLVSKIAKGATENLKYYCLLTTSQCYEGSLKKEVPSLLFTGFILFAGIFLAIRGMKQKLSTQRQDFLALLLIWIAVFTILTIPVSFQLRPRFYIVVFATPFILLGLIYEYFEQKISRKHSLIFAVIFSLGIVIWNSHGTYVWFKEQAKSQNQSLAVKRTLILKSKDGVTLGQLQKATDWMYEHHKQGTNLYYYIKPEHQRPIQFLLSEKHDKNLRFANISLNGDPKAEYFAITKAKDGIAPVEEKYKTDIEINDSQQFGQIKVWQIKFPNREVDSNFVLKDAKKDESDRIYWKDVFKFLQKKD